MAWAASRRATLLIPSGPIDDPAKKHLYIVLNDPVGVDDEVLLVCICTIPSSQIYDGSCTLFPGEHPFVVKDSYVAYNFAQISKAEHVEKQVAGGKFIAKAPVDEKYFQYILEGLAESPRASLKVKKFLAATLGKGT
jgi:hypothetical protein